MKGQNPLPLQHFGNALPVFEVEHDPTVRVNRYPVYCRSPQLLLGGNRQVIKFRKLKEHNADSNSIVFHLLPLQFQSVEPAFRFLELAATFREHSAMPTDWSDEIHKDYNLISNMTS